MIPNPTEPPNAPPTIAPRSGLEELEAGLVGVGEPDIKNETVDIATVLVGKSVEGRVIETT